jgi:hypothetical protein
MKLAVIYLKLGDTIEDGARTARVIVEEQKGAIIAYESAFRRDELRGEFGTPIYYAEAETPSYRDVDIFEVGPKR